MGLKASRLLRSAAGWSPAATMIGTGVKALVSGDPQTGGLYNALRGFGFSDESAQTILATTSGLPATAAKQFSRAQLEDAADRALLISASDPFNTRGIGVTADGTSVWQIKDIQARGIAWEIADSKLTGYDLTPPGMKTFDQVSEDRTVAISNKTLDLRADFYGSASPANVQSWVKKMIDDVANFTKGNCIAMPLTGAELEQRELHLLIPAGRAEPGQETQLAAAGAYAKSRSVVMTIAHGR